jgi:hypothetical protein
MRWTIILCTGLLACGITGPQAADDETTADPGSGATTGSGAGSTGVAGGGGSGTSSGSGAGSSGTGSGNGSNSSSGAGGMTGDPNCYTEPLNPSASITDIVSAYGGSNYKDEIIEAMDRRWPAGAWLLTEQKNDPYFAQFSDSSSWTGTVSWLDTLVHEETHLFDAYHAQGQGEAHALYFRDDLIVYLPAEQGFERSEILSQLIAAAQNGIYASTYLTGSQGDRKLNPLLDEATCYANEVPGMASFGEYYSGGVSLRDGSAAFLYFIQVYLRVARTNHASFYTWAKSQPAYVDAVRILWLRTHFFYEEVGDMYPNLGISDDVYRAEAYKTENLAEIELFIGRKVNDSSCLQD